jgi:hypothetical protein
MLRIQIYKLLISNFRFVVNVYVFFWVVPSHASMWVVTLHGLSLYSAPTIMTFLMAPTLKTFLMAQANFEPTFSCINTLTILKPSHSSYLPAYEDWTDRVFRNVGIQNSDAGELPIRKHTTYLNSLSLDDDRLNFNVSGPYFMMYFWLHIFLSSLLSPVPITHCIHNSIQLCHFCSNLDWAIPRPSSWLRSIHHFQPPPLLHRRT